MGYLDQQATKKVRQPYTNPSVTFTRPADTTAYAANDLVANSVTAGSVSPPSLTVSVAAAAAVVIRRVRLKKSTTSATNATFRIHLFAVTAPTVTNGDNGAFAVATGSANYLGNFIIGAMVSLGDGCVGFGVPSVGGEIGLKLASGTVVYALLEALAAYTPGNAETFTITLESAEQ
jgi:hypothetical protein